MSFLFSNSEKVKANALKIAFKEKPSESRKAESQKILEKYPGKIPIVCEVAKSEGSTITLDKTKFLVPKDLTAADFITVLRKRIKLTAEKALFLFTDDNQLATLSQTLSQIYSEKKNEDGFLYFIVSEESTFG